MKTAQRSGRQGDDRCQPLASQPVTTAPARPAKGCASGRLKRPVAQGGRFLWGRARLCSIVPTGPRMEVGESGLKPHLPCHERVSTRIISGACGRARIASQGDDRLPPGGGSTAAAIRLISREGAGRAVCDSRIDSGGGSSGHHDDAHVRHERAVGTSSLCLELSTIKH